MPVIEPGMKPFVIKSAERSQAEYVRFSFEGMGWANVIFKDNGPRCGELIIHSDWGNFAYAWGGMADGETLKTFLVKADDDYIARKLIPHADHTEWDPEKTKEKMREELQRLVKSKAMGEEEASDVYEAMEEWDWTMGLDIWLTTAPSEVTRWFEALHEWYETRPTSTWLWLKEGALPAIRAWLKKEMESDVCHVTPSDVVSGGLEEVRIAVHVPAEVAKQLREGRASNFSIGGKSP